MDRWMGNSNFAEIFRVDDGWMDGWIVCVCVWMYLGSWGVGSAKETKLTNGEEYGGYAGYCRC